jgi:hypothetical protein
MEDSNDPEGPDLGWLLGKALVAKYAPVELPIYDDVAGSLSPPGQRKSRPSEHPLAFGLEILASPTLHSVGEAISMFLLGLAADTIKDVAKQQMTEAIRSWIDRNLHRPPPTVLTKSQFVLLSSRVSGILEKSSADDAIRRSVIGELESMLDPTRQVI